MNGSRLGGAVLAFAVGPVVVAMLLSLALIMVIGDSPYEALSALIAGSLGGTVPLARTASLLLPLTAVALAWILSFRTGRINIGFEGQLIIGGIVGAIIGLAVALPSPVHIVLALGAGALGGAAYAWIAGFLWAEYGVNEIISTLLLNLIALEVLAWLVRGPLQGGPGFPRSDAVAESTQLPRIVAHSALTWDILFVPLLILLVWFLLKRTTLGMSMRLTGSNPEAAERVGISTNRVTIGAFLLGGAISGLVGASLVLGGETSRLAESFASDFGFIGIVVALVAVNRPLAVIAPAILFAILQSGSGLMETRVGVPAELIMVTQGIVIIAVTSGTYLLERARRRRLVSDRSTIDGVDSLTLSSLD